MMLSETVRNTLSNIPAISGVRILLSMSNNHFYCGVYQGILLEFCRICSLNFKFHHIDGSHKKMDPSYY